MGCNSCNKDRNGLPRGCNNNGNCASGTCGTFTVFDWLADISSSISDKFKIVEVRFKNGRKGYFRNNDLIISKGNPIITESTKGYDIGEITLTGELVKNQLKKKGIKIDDELFSLLRYPNENEINKWQDLIKKELKVQIKARKIAIELGLKMKISDVEYQADGSKLTFYYTAEGRVDFRELIKKYAVEFKTRIEMKQVGFREEASRIGGIGSCGRELCCSSWLKDLRKVNISSARYQKLSINPQKLAGQCGKLKCCLNYELDTYLDALKDFPKKDFKIKTKKGIAILQKTDIFKKRVWYAYKDNFMEWFEFDLNGLNKMININNSDEHVSALEDYSLVYEEDSSKKTEYSITRFDRIKKRKNAI